MFFVEFTETAKKEIKKLGSVGEKIHETLKKELQTNPTDRGKFFGRSKQTGLLYWEKKFYRGAGYRAYYTVIKGVVTIEDIEYLGRTRVDRVTKKSQQSKTQRDLSIG